MSESHASARSRVDMAQVALGQLRDLLDDLGVPGREIALSSAMMAGAAGCAVMSLVTMHQATLRALEAVLPRSAAGALLVAGYGALAAALAAAARSKLVTVADTAERAVREQVD